MSEDTNRTIIVATPAEYRLVYRVDRSKGMQTPFLEVELTRAGIRQAEQLGARLVNCDLDHIIYTPAEECKYTANIVAEILPGKHSPKPKDELRTPTGIETRLIEAALKGLPKGPIPSIRPIRGGGIIKQDAIKQLVEKIEEEPATTLLMIVTPDISAQIGHYLNRSRYPTQPCQAKTYTLSRGLNGARRISAIEIKEKPSYHQ